jgi:hypothetical protein
VRGADLVGERLAHVALDGGRIGRRRAQAHGGLMGLDRLNACGRRPRGVEFFFEGRNLR